METLLKLYGLVTSELDNYFVCKRFAVQTLLWSLEFVININLEHDNIAAIYNKFYMYL